jgi:signal transduction histidine kinase
MENQLDKMRWLILNLLKLSKLDAGTAEFKIEGISSKKLIDESLKPFLVTLDLKGITLVNDVKDFAIHGDFNWSVEAFGNIIKNCIEHTDKNGSLMIESKSTNIYDEIIIRDNGCGISNDDLPHIFERFYHGKNSSSDSVGIGLALAKTVFEREKGSVSVKSEENVGTQFNVRFYKAIV